MKLSLKTRIFFPILVVIMILIIGIWASFALVSENYIIQTARNANKKTISYLSGIDVELRNEYDDLKSKEDTQNYSKELLKKIKQSIREKKLNTNIIIYNSKEELVYTNMSNYNVDLKEISEKSKELINAKESSGMVEDVININGEKWYVTLFSMNTEYNVRTKHFVSLSKLLDISLMWGYMGKLVISVTFITVIFGAILAILVSENISCQIKGFCKKLNEIENEESGQIDGAYNITEIEMLRKTYNNMEMKVRKSKETKDNFFQNVSHDLKTPLVSIIGYAQAIKFNVIADKTKAVDIIISESTRMKNMVESILYISKIDSGDMKINKVKVDLDVFLEEFVDAISGMAMEYGININLNTEKILIDIDPELINRIMQNIVSNCIRYANLNVNINLSRCEDKALIYIEDDGKGFKDEEISYIYDKFYYGENGEFGIGLSFVKNAIEYIGGNIEVGNCKPPKAGAFYKLYIPLY